MIEIRMHGRGGQGAAVSSQILADAFFREGKEVQSFPMFGVERRGAPVAAFVRVDDKPIHARCELRDPKFVMVLDPTLVANVDISGGIKPGGLLVINSSDKSLLEKFKGEYKVMLIDGTAIAIKHGLGSRVAPIVNTVMLGAFAKASGLVSIDSVCKCIQETFPKDKGANAEAAREAYETLKTN
jgi:2-oxoacid:acceptor oxidoreductase gamma subunit (pyruvate/2-ketoisovalerate family)